MGLVGPAGGLDEVAPAIRDSTVPVQGIVDPEARGEGGTRPLPGGGSLRVLPPEAWPVQRPSLPLIVLAGSGAADRLRLAVSLQTARGGGVVATLDLSPEVGFHHVPARG